MDLQVRFGVLVVIFQKQVTQDHNSNKASATADAILEELLKGLPTIDMMTHQPWMGRMQIDLFWRTWMSTTENATY